MQLNLILSSFNVEDQKQQFIHFVLFLSTNSFLLVKNKQQFFFYFIFWSTHTPSPERGSVYIPQIRLCLLLNSDAGSKRWINLPLNQCLNCKQQFFFGLTNNSSLWRIFMSSSVAYIGPTALLGVLSIRIELYSPCGPTIKKEWRKMKPKKHNIYIYIYICT